jgi:hypothetical protein
MPSCTRCMGELRQFERPWLLVYWVEVEAPVRLLLDSLLAPSFYRPTETTVISSTYPTAKFTEDMGAVPVGRCAIVLKVA